ncbi:MAG TPA: class I SAM-dependent methyltransferase [Bryobacteraceae bacterium]|nr:class I SAM-dependent methyltransferase [Bryobacteraceae bacterium]
MVLDVGCGKRKIESDAIGIDVSPDSAADHIWNLDRYPWPLESCQFSRIYMSHIIEHLDDPMRAMAEVYRVAVDGADVFITTPHFSSHNSYVDPTHKRHLAAASFDYFTGRDFPTFAGSACRFDVVRVELTFGGNFVLDNLGRFLAHRSMKWYERHAAWIFPALDIRCHLRARKQGAG